MSLTLICHYIQITLLCNKLVYKKTVHFWRVENYYLKKLLDIEPSHEKFLAMYMLLVKSPCKLVKAKMKCLGFYWTTLSATIIYKLFSLEVQKRPPLMGPVLLQETGVPGENLQCLVETNWVTCFSHVTKVILPR